MKKINWNRMLSTLMAVMLAVAVFCGSTVSAAEKFGGVEFGGTLGGYTIVDTSAAKLPQDAATAIGAANNEMLGATYTPIWYVGKQLVNGTNYLFIAEEIRTTRNQDKHIVGLVINVPPGEHSEQGKGTKVVRIIESEELAPEVQAAFSTVEKGLVGVSYKPVMYIGSQVVRGVNHFIVCEAKTIYPGAQPYAVMLCVNIFEGKTSLVGIAPISSNEKETLCGYAFTW